MKKMEWWQWICYFNLIIFWDSYGLLLKCHSKYDSWLDVSPQTYWSTMKCVQKWRACILKLFKKAIWHCPDYQAQHYRNTSPWCLGWVDGGILSFIIDTGKSSDVCNIVALLCILWVWNKAFIQWLPDIK